MIMEEEKRRRQAEAQIQAAQIALEQQRMQQAFQYAHPQKLLQYPAPV